MARINSVTIRTASGGSDHTWISRGENFRLEADVQVRNANGCTLDHARLNWVEVTGTRTIGNAIKVPVEWAAIRNPLAPRAQWKWYDVTQSSVGLKASAMREESTYAFTLCGNTDLDRQQWVCPQLSNVPQKLRVVTVRVVTKPRVIKVYNPECTSADLRKCNNLEGQYLLNADIGGCEESQSFTCNFQYFSRVFTETSDVPTTPITGVTPLNSTLLQARVVRRLPVGSNTIFIAVAKVYRLGSMEKEVFTRNRYTTVGSVSVPRWTPPEVEEIKENPTKCSLSDVRDKLMQNVTDAERVEIVARIGELVGDNSCGDRLVEESINDLVEVVNKVNVSLAEVANATVAQQASINQRREEVSIAIHDIVRGKGNLKSADERNVWDLLVKTETPKTWDTNLDTADRLVARSRSNLTRFCRSLREDENYVGRFQSSMQRGMIAGEDVAVHHEYLYSNARKANFRGDVTSVTRMSNGSTFVFSVDGGSLPKVGAGYVYVSYRTNAENCSREMYHNRDNEPLQSAIVDIQARSPGGENLVAEDGNQAFKFSIPLYCKPVDNPCCDVGNLQCRWFNHSIGEWSSEGCEFKGFDEVNGNNALCECSHLTEFAMAMARVAGCKSQASVILGVRQPFFVSFVLFVLLTLVAAYQAYKLESTGCIDGEEVKISRKRKLIVYIHYLIILIGTLRACSALFLGHVDSEGVPELFALDLIALLFLYWLYSFVVSQWLAIFHYAAQCPTGDTFPIIQYAYLVCNSIVTMLIFGLVVYFCYMFADIRTGNFTAIQTFAKFGQLAISAFSICLASAFIFYGVNLSQKVSLAAAQAGREPPAIVKRLYLATIILSTGFICKGGVGIWIAFDLSLFMAHIDFFIYLHYASEVAMLSTVLFVYAQYINSAVASTRNRFSVDNLGIGLWMQGARDRLFNRVTLPFFANPFSDWASQDGGLRKSIGGTLVADDWYGDDDCYRLSMVSNSVKKMAEAGEFGECYTVDSDEDGSASYGNTVPNMAGVMSRLGAELGAPRSTWAEFIEDDTRRQTQLGMVSQISDGSSSHSSSVVGGSIAEQRSVEFQNYKTSVGGSALKSRESRIHGSSIMGIQALRINDNSDDSSDEDDSHDFGRVEMVDMKTYKTQRSSAGKSIFQSRQSRLFGEELRRSMHDLRLDLAKEYHSESCESASSHSSDLEAVYSAAKRKQKSPLNHDNVMRASIDSSARRHAPLMNRYSTAISMKSDSPLWNDVQEMANDFESNSGAEGSYDSESSSVETKVNEKPTRRPKTKDSTPLHGSISDDKRRSSHWDIGLLKGLEEDLEDTSSPATSADSSVMDHTIATKYSEFEEFVSNLRNIDFFPEKGSSEYDRKFNKAIERFKRKCPGKPVPSHRIRSSRSTPKPKSYGIEKTSTILFMEQELLAEPHDCD